MVNHDKAGVLFLDCPRWREAAGGVNRYCLFLVAGGGVGRILVSNVALFLVSVRRIAANIAKLLGLLRKN
jgi:hypothetical protein